MNDDQLPLVADLCYRAIVIAIGIIAFFANITPVILLLRSKRLFPNHIRTYYISLTVADSILSFGYVITNSASIHTRLEYRASNETGWQSQLTCSLIKSPLIFGLLMDAFILLVISADRLLAVSKPVLYHVHSGRVSKVHVSVAVIISIIITSFNFIGADSNKSVLYCGSDFNRSFYRILNAVISICSISVTVIYLMAISVVKKHQSLRNQSDLNHRSQQKLNNENRMQTMTSQNRSSARISTVDERRFTTLATWLVICELCTTVAGCAVIGTSKILVKNLQTAMWITNSCSLFIATNIVFKVFVLVWQNRLLQLETKSLLKSLFGRSCRGRSIKIPLDQLTSDDMEIIPISRESTSKRLKENRAQSFSIQNSLPRS